jgi:hypothetical protein
MKKTKKRTKMAMATFYGIKNAAGKWYSEHTFNAFGSLSGAMLFTTRAEARECRNRNETIAPVRVRELPSKKKNAKRTG